SRISQYYYAVNPLKSFPYANQALQLAEKIKWKRGIANLHNNIGLYINDTGNNALAREHYQIAYQLNIELGAKVNQVNNLNNIGRSYQFESEYTKASENFFKALTIAEDLKDNDLISVVGTNLTHCFTTQKNYPKANEYAEMTLKHANLANNTRNIIKALLQLGNISASLKDTVMGKMYMNKALVKARESGNTVDEATILGNLANLYYPDYKKQMELMLRVNGIMDKINPNSEVSLVNNTNLGEIYINMAEHSTTPDKTIYMKKAEDCLSRAKVLAAQNAGAEYLSNIYRMLVHLEEVKGNYKTALGYYKKSTAIDDSLFSQEKKNAIAGLEGKHNIAIKDDEIAINKLKLAVQRKTQLGLIAGLALLVVIGGLLYWQSRSRKKTNTTLMVLNNQLDEANKVKARFFGILSHDLRSPIVNLVHFLQLQKDSPDLLSEEQQIIHRQNISNSAEDLLNTMEAMLLWSKEQMENFKPNIKNIAVDDLFAHIRKFFGQTAQINFTFNYVPGLMVLADENYLRTIMQNLTSNAVRALKNTSPATIVWEAKKEDNTTILSITDNGPGIGPAQAKALFEDSIVNNEKTGFGFHLIRDLAKAIHYRITVQSEQGMGTTFTLSKVAA
ncbi:MAG TPA: tetratricopeptide repeat-containing sensor histidine kinase, partial [Chitinophagaceae bacterium]|nr:tetratricopeptide repeat-containing sensor histidine kinase [Chitinophagaceae bacterium]